MDYSALMAISPIDGRYRNHVESLSNYFSEFALIRYRVMVEIEYFIALCNIPLEQLRTFDYELFPKLRDIYKEFSAEDAIRVKNIEKETNHDVKAVEYFIKERFTEFGLVEYSEFIHFGLTSQDINNTAVPLSLLEGIQDVFIPLLCEVIDILDGFAQEWSEIPMLARTHGQPASPTRVGIGEG